MSKTLIALLSFLLGSGIGIILMSCLMIEKENQKNGESEKNK